MVVKFYMFLKLKIFSIKILLLLRPWKADRSRSDEEH